MSFEVIDEYPDMTEDIANALGNADVLMARAYGDVLSDGYLMVLYILDGKVIFSIWTNECIYMLETEIPGVTKIRLRAILEDNTLISNVAEIEVADLQEA